MIKPWIFEFCAPPADPGLASRDVYDWYLDLWQQGEDAGFEGVFFSEHHFVPGRLSPSPHLLIAALSQRTQRLRLGVMGVVLPLNEPWRVAEEAAMLDHLCGGRLEVGMASGSAPMEFLAVGIDGKEIRPRFEEALEVVQQALTQPRVNFQGEFWKLTDLAISPRPLQTPPPQWIPVLSPGSATLAARHGCRICAGFYSVADLAPVFDRYREASAGKAGADDLAIRRMVFLSDDAAEAAAIADSTVEAWRGILPGPSRASDQRLPNADARKVPDAPAPSAGRPAVSDQEAIGGSPADVAEQIVDQCRQLGAGHFLAYLFGDLSRAQIERNYALWREVIPRLRKAGIR